MSYSYAENMFVGNLIRFGQTDDYAEIISIDNDNHDTSVELPDCMVIFDNDVPFVQTHSSEGISRFDVVPGNDYRVYDNKD